MGKLFKLQILGLKGNPLSTDIMTLFSEVNGTDKILSYLLDNLPSKSTLNLLPPNLTFSAISLSFLPRPSCFCLSTNAEADSNHDSKSPLDLNNGWLELRASALVWRAHTAGHVVTSIALSKKWDQEPSDMVFFLLITKGSERIEKWRCRNYYRLRFHDSIFCVFFTSNPKFFFPFGILSRAMAWLLTNMRLFSFLWYFVYPFSPPSRWVCESIGGC